MKTTITIILISFCFLSLYGQEQSSKKEFNKNGTISFMNFSSKEMERSIGDIEGIFKDSLGVGDGNILRLRRTENDNIGFKHLYYDQYYNGVKVEYGIYSVHLKKERIEYMTGNYQMVKNISTKPILSDAEALKSALKLVGATQYMWEDFNEERVLKVNTGSDQATYFPKAELVIMQNILAGTGTYHLAYKIDIFAKRPMSHKIYYIDASNGSLLYSEELIKHNGEKSKTLDVKNNAQKNALNNYDLSISSPHYKFANTAALGDTRYSGNQSFTSDSFSGGYRLREIRNGVSIQTLNLRGKGNNYSGATDFTDADNNWTAAEFNNSNKDNVALDAHWASEKVYDYFYNFHNRNSWNNQGGSLTNYVHSDLRSFGNPDDDNAFWNGQNMVYGDGENRFHPLTSLDIVAHEIGHGVMQTSAGLIYNGESGALNEGFSDIWAASIVGTYAPSKQRWLIGSEVSFYATPLRSMSNPNLGSPAQPDTYGGTNWYNVLGCSPNNNNDQCGVHYNSGVLNYWFYLLTEGGSGTNDIGNAFTVGGIGLLDAGKIAYRTISTVLTNPQATYNVVRSATIQAAKDLFGTGSCQEIATTAAWYAVGVGSNYAGSTIITGPTTFCSTQSYSTGEASTVWSVTNITGGSCSLSTTTGSATTLSFSSPGKSILKASKTICGMMVTSTKEIYYGAPVKSLLSVRGTTSVSSPNQPADYGIRYDGQDVCGGTKNKASLTNIEWEVSPSASNIAEGSMACAMDYPTGAGKAIRFGSTGTKLIRIRAQNACGWSDWTDWAAFTVNVSGSGKFNYVYYPNPAKNIINVAYTDNGLERATTESRTFSVKLYDGYGKVLIDSQSKDGAILKLDVQNITNGTYYLHLTNDGKTEKKQVIISR